MKIKIKMNKWDPIQLKNYCTAKETINKMKRQLTEWEKLFAHDVRTRNQNYNEVSPHTGWSGRNQNAYKQ